jgi:hypothetical protein
MSGFDSLYAKVALFASDDFCQCKFWIDRLIDIDNGCPPNSEGLALKTVVIECNFFCTSPPRRGGQYS